jgi:hypothetical protein
VRPLRELRRRDRGGQSGLWRALLLQLQGERSDVEREGLGDRPRVEATHHTVGVRRAAAPAFGGHEEPFDHDVAGDRRSHRDRRRVHPERHPPSDHQHGRAVIERERRDHVVTRLAVQGSSVHDHLAFEVVRALGDDPPEGSQGGHVGRRSDRYRGRGSGRHDRGVDGSTIVEPSQLPEAEADARRRDDDRDRHDREATPAGALHPASAPR